MVIVFAEASHCSISTKLQHSYANRPPVLAFLAGWNFEEDLWNDSKLYSWQVSGHLSPFSPCHLYLFDAETQWTHGGVYRFWGITCHFKSMNWPTTRKYQSILFNGHWRGYWRVTGGLLGDFRRVYYQIILCNIFTYSNIQLITQSLLYIMSLPSIKTKMDWLKAHADVMPRIFDVLILYKGKNCQTSKAYHSTRPPPPPPIKNILFLGDRGLSNAYDLHRLVKLTCPFVRVVRVI